jgi:DNA-binding response OmpR family regulator
MQSRRSSWSTLRIPFNQQQVVWRQLCTRQVDLVFALLVAAGGKMNPKIAIVVEDDRNLSLIFSEAVRKAGYQVVTYHSGDEALLGFDQVTPDLIVLDLHLPSISGVDLLHRIRSLAHMAKTRVVLATADPLLAEIYSDQVEFVLVKPISFVQLRDLAKRLIEQ